MYSGKGYAPMPFSSHSLGYQWLPLTTLCLAHPYLCPPSSKAEIKVPTKMEAVPVWADDTKATTNPQNKRMHTNVIAGIILRNLIQQEAEMSKDETGLASR